MSSESFCGDASTLRMSRAVLLLLLLLLLHGALASHFLGVAMTYYPKEVRPDGSVLVTFRYKTNFHSCSSSDVWTCGGCGTSTITLNKVDEESSGEWCQREGILLWLLPSSTSPVELLMTGGDWIHNIRNGIRRWRAVTWVETRNRSDTGRPNISPQTTILPAVRVPSNCRRDFDLLAFDPDGDDVKCRYGVSSECNPCTLPSVLSLSSSCTLSFNSTTSSNEGPYAVQLVMEDFPRQTITLTHTNGGQTIVPPSQNISKIPVQFVVRVDPAVPSCSEGVFLPKFLPPTPANRAQLTATVNQTLEITINAEASNSTISELLFSGPYNVAQNTTGPGQFTLRWTPSESESEESHPICFVVQAESSSSSAKYHSELRCVIVTVGKFVIVALQMRLSSSLLPSDENIRIISQGFKDELVRRGLPSNIWVLLSNGQVAISTTAPPGS